MTPFIALYGYHPPSITSSLKEKSKVQAVEDRTENQQQVLQILKDNLNMAQNRMKEQADQHRSERSFEKIGTMAYKLELPASS
jgi:DNA-binding ferritin-like protein